MRKPPNWIVDVFDCLPDSGIIVDIEMQPYRKWCQENIGPMQHPLHGYALNWWNDLYDIWYEVHFRKPEDATAFMLMSGGKRAR